MDSVYFNNLPTKERNLLLVSVLAHLPEIVLLLDIENSVNLLVNKSIFSLLGYSQEDVYLMGDNVLQELIHPDDFSLIPGLFAHFRNLKKGKYFDHVNRWKHVRGHYLTISNKVIPFRWHGHSATVVLGISSDITEKEKKQKTIDLQLDNIKDINHIISHQLGHEYAKISGVFNLINENIDLSYDELRQIQHALKGSVNQLNSSIVELNNKLTMLTNLFAELND